MTSLDHAVSSAITQLHALERSLHDIGPWSMSYRGEMSPAERTVLDDGVLFSAEFRRPLFRFTAPGYLMCGDDVVLSFPIPSPVDDSEFFIADLKLRLGNAVLV